MFSRDVAGGAGEAVGRGELGREKEGKEELGFTGSAEGGRRD